MKNSTYDKAFYESRHNETKKSAQHLLNHLFNFYKPNSVVDFGCGVGTWLGVCKELGTSKIKGFEGPWLDTVHLVIDKNEFNHADLTTKMTFEEKFDMAITLEVAEHIVKEKADIFLDNLTASSDVILFSAAIPNQGGVDHVNEQWPSYWIAKFAERGYKVVDIIRPALWNNAEVKLWYKQNSLLFVKENKHIEALSQYKDNGMHDIVHPQMFQIQVYYRHPLHVSYKEVIKFFPKMTWNALKRVFKK
jgi:SAM-dependent methyltransferase